MKDKIYEVLTQVFKVDESDIEVVSRLLGGMSHYTYHVRVLEVDYTIRIIGKSGNLYVNRVEELDNMIRIIKLGINNETIYFDQESGIKIARYVKGTVLTETDVYKHLDSIAKTLKKLHKSGIEAANYYNPIQRLDRYESFANQRSTQYLKLKDNWIHLYETTYKPKKFVFCHNDAQRSNMVLGKDQLYLLDWEYSAMNDPFYDIASFGNVDFSDALKLLDIYLGRKSTEEEKNKVRFYRMYQGLQWHQVALYKHEIGLSEELQMPFDQLAKKYLDLAQTLYQEIKG